MILNRKAFQEWGRIGGRTRAARLSKARLRQIALGAVSKREEKKKMGRPTTFTEDKKNIAIKMFGNGATLQQIADVVGLSRERVRQILKVIGVDPSTGGRAIRGLLSSHSHISEENRKQRKREQLIFERYGITLELFELFSKEYGRASLPSSPLHKYRSQKTNATHRGIEWNITLAEWWRIWQLSGHWQQRGRGNGYCMSRLGDTGAYAVGNVEIKTIGENSSESFIKHPWEERLPTHTGSKKTQCLRGHLRTPENVYKNGCCKLCEKERRNGRG